MSDRSEMALRVAAAIVNNKDGEDFAKLFLMLLEPTRAYGAREVEDWMDLGRAVSVAKTPASWKVTKPAFNPAA